MGERIQKVFEDPYKSSKCESYLQNGNHSFISHIQFNTTPSLHRSVPWKEMSLTHQNTSFYPQPSTPFYRNNNVSTNCLPPFIDNTRQSSICSSSFVNNSFQSQSSTFPKSHYNHYVSNTTSKVLAPYVTKSSTVLANSMGSFTKTLPSTRRSPYLKSIPSLTDNSSYLRYTNNPTFSQSVAPICPYFQGKNVPSLYTKKKDSLQYPITPKVSFFTKGPKQIYCDICEKDFYSKERYATHIENDHFPCGFPGCNYSAPVLILNAHKLKHIKGENQNNILDDPIEIKKWINARKENFPTRTKNKIKQDSLPCAIERILRQQYMQEKSYGKYSHTKCAIVPELSSLLKRTKRWRYPDLFKKQHTRLFQNRNHSSFEFSYKDLITDFPVCEHFLKFKSCKWSPCNFSHDIGLYRRWKTQRNARGLDIAMRPPLLYQLLLSELKKSESLILLALQFIVKNIFFEKKNGHCLTKSESFSSSDDFSTSSEKSFSSSQDSSNVLSVEYIDDNTFYEDL